jgi:hypothetical protein
MFLFASAPVRASEAAKAGSAGPLSPGVLRRGIAVQAVAFEAVFIRGTPFKGLLGVHRGPIFPISDRMVLLTAGSFSK